MPTIRDCSSADKPLSAEAVCAGHTQRAGLVASDAGLAWLENDPVSGRVRPFYFDGQTVHAPDIGAQSLGSRLNGYGGGALAILERSLILVADDQSVVSVNLDTGQLKILVSAGNGSWGGLVSDPKRRRVLAIREHRRSQALMALSLAGYCECLHQGEDFYGAPALSDDGNVIAWVSWRLPDMPWHRSHLWVGRLDDRGHVRQARALTPPAEGSVQQPVFYGEVLYALSDHAGWWQPWKIPDQSRDKTWEAVPVPDCDHANAPWQLGERHHVVLPDGRWAMVRYVGGTGELWLGYPGDAGGQRVAEGFSDFRSLSVYNGRLCCLARSADHLDAVIEIVPDSGKARVIAGGESPLASVVMPEPFCIPASDACEHDVHGFLYRPAGHKGRRPPLILFAHGGPTSAAYPVYHPQVQFWCQRGFAVAEVNYRGSSGFGRAFRHTLAGHWGVSDVEDMRRAARYLPEQFLLDDQSVFIQGRSSGGFTVLMALMAGDEFCGGASLFGVTDPLRLREQTHRFESGYLDWLLGDPKAHPERWAARTPLHHAQSIRVPVVFFQGGQDTVVVPQQTRSMVAAIKAAGGSPELHWFEHEGHGFRDPGNQAEVLNALYAFYDRHRLREP